MCTHTHEHSGIHVHRHSGPVENMTEAAQPHGKPTGLPVRTQTGDNILPSILYTYKVREDATWSLTPPGLLHQSLWKIERALSQPRAARNGAGRPQGPVWGGACRWVVSGEVTFSGC